MALLGKLLVSLGLDTAEFDDGASSSKDKLNNFAGEMTKVGGVLSAGITAPLVGVGVAALDASTKLNEGMANVQSLGLTQQRVTELKAGVQDLAINVGKGTDDMTAGLYQVESAFGDGAETLKDLEINAKAASAGMATTKEAIDLTSAVTKGYGDTSAAAIQHVADLALKTVALGQTDFPQLAGAIGGVVPLTKQLSIGQEELFAVMATATGVTGGASEVATQMKGSLQALMAPTKDMSALMDQLGYANGEAMIKSLGYKGSMEAIVKAAHDSGTPLQAYMGSIEGQTLALTLAGAQSANYDSKLAQLQDATGATQTAFEAQTQGINANGFAMAQAKEKMEVMLQRLGDGLGPALAAAANAAAPLIDKVLGLATQFSQLDPQTQTLIVTIAAVAAAAGPVVLAIGAVTAGIAALMSPITLVVIALVALYVAWQTNFGGIRDYTNTALTAIKGYWERHKTEVSALASDMWGNLKLETQMGVTGITGLLQAGHQAWNGDWKGAGETLKATAQTMWGQLRELYHNGLDEIKNLFALFGWKDLGENISKGIAEGITAGLSWIKDAASNAAQSALDAGKSLLGIHSPSTRAAAEIGVPFMQGFAVGAEGEFGSVTGRLRDGFGSLMGKLSADTNRSFGPTISQDRINLMSSLLGIGTDSFGSSRRPQPAAAGAGFGAVEVHNHFYGNVDRNMVATASEQGALAGQRQRGMR